MGTMTMSGDGDELARSFGFDITMPDGNVGLPSAVHKEYMEQCRVIYRNFVNNMSMHMKTQKELRKALRALHEEKIRNLRFSLYRCDSSDPFARKPATAMTSTPCLDSRINTPWGLDIIPDEEEQSALRPQTAPTGIKPVTIDNRPQTAGIPLRNATTPHNCEVEDADDMDDNLSQFSGGTRSTVMGVVDRKLERSSSRKITVGTHGFVKITHGKVRAELKSKDGRFLVKPVRVSENDLELATIDNAAYDPLTARQAYDPSSERLALVRQITSFKTPTISSDMKINNRVPIQKSLMGIKSKRITVSEIYQSARDRRTRHFRIVPYKPGGTLKNAHGVPLVKSTTHGGENGMDRSRGLWARLGTSILQGELRRSSNNAAEATPSSVSAKGRGNIHNSSSSKSLSESFNGKSRAESAPHAGPKRPGSKVSFVRADSQLSAADSVFASSGDNVDLGASMRSSASIADRKSKLQPPTESRLCSDSGNKENDFRSRANVCYTGTHAPESRSYSGNANLLTVENVSRIGDLSPRRHPENRTVSDLRSELAASVLSAEVSPKVKTQKGKLNNDGSVTGDKRNVKNAGNVSARSVHSSNDMAPTAGAAGKMDSRKDTVKVVKQQMRMDKALDEKMTVWRRRMAIKASVASSPARPKFNRNNKMM